MRKNREEKSTVSLPEKLSEPIKSPSEIITLLYGEPKIGKTSFASQFPDTMFLMFEPGGRALKIYQRPVTKWQEFIGYVDLLEKENKFKTVVIDTIDLCYERCLAYVLKKEGMDWPTDKGYGQGWKLVKNEFADQITRLCSTKAVVFISHASYREVATRGGRTYNKIMPSMTGQGYEFIYKLSTLIGFYGYYGDKRYLTITGDDEIVAGRQLEVNFLTPKGKQVHSIPMGDSKEEAYKNFLAAFNNKQPTDGKPESGKVALTPIKPKIGGRK